MTYSLQDLRNDVIGIRNRKKIKEIIEQNPEVSDKSYTSEIRHDPKPQSNNWFLGLFIDKVLFYIIFSKDMKRFIEIIFLF